MRVLPLLLLLACAGGDSVDGDYPPGLPLDANLIECAVVEDCEVVELGCCDACNGGLAVAVNSASVQEVRDTYQESCGLKQGCTEMGCPPWELSCDAGVCGLQRGTF